MPGGHAMVQERDGHLLLGAALRNVGNGLAVLHGWHIVVGRILGDIPHADLDDFRTLTRDLFVPAGTTGFWQGTIRDADDPQFEELRDALEASQPFTIELLYGDHEGIQRFVSRMLIARRDADDWSLIFSRHWPV